VAATAAAAPHAKTNHVTFVRPVTRRNISAGRSADAQIRSLRNAWLPRPSAKNAYRQLSCNSSPGSIRPSARKAPLAVPSSSAAATSTQAPATMPTTAAVPVQLATARRH
jgi:hypothetical protein